MEISEEGNDHLPLISGRALVCTVLSLSLVIGIPGNMFVIWTIWAKMKKRPLTVVLILHLSIADLLVLLTLPIWIYSFANSWLFEIITCKVLAFAVYCSMYASIFLITTLSLERFMAVFYPFFALQWKNKMAVILVTLIWLFAVLFGAAIIPFQVIDDTGAGPQCAARMYESDMQEVAFLLLEMLVGFVVPFGIISICYACIGRRIRKMTCPTRKRSARLIASVVVAFCLCWLPHHFFNLITVISILTENSHPRTSEVLTEILEVGVHVAGSITFISSCINPLLYAFAARNFQSTMRLPKLSRLFEQLSPSVKQPSLQDLPSTGGKKEALMNTEVI